MKNDLICPVELREYELKNENGRPTAVLRLYNQTERRIDSFEAVAKWRSASGRSLACPITASNLRASGQNMFTYSLSTDRLPDAETIELLFTSVRYEDGTPDWRPGEGPRTAERPVLSAVQTVSEASENTDELPYIPRPAVHAEFKTIERAPAKAVQNRTQRSLKTLFRRAFALAVVALAVVAVLTIAEPGNPVVQAGATVSAMSRP